MTGWQYASSFTHFPELCPSNTNPNKFSLLPSPKAEGQDEGIHITTFWDWYYMRIFYFLMLAFVVSYFVLNILLYMWVYISTRNYDLKLSLVDPKKIS